MHAAFLFRIRFALPVLALLAVGLWGCATPRQGPELPEVAIGVAEFHQPQSIVDMLAGFMPEDAPRIPEKILTELDATFAEVLETETKRKYASMETFRECRDAKASGQATGRAAALRRWVAVGECMGVEFLLVPQAYEWNEREGGQAGVTRPAGVVLDFFLVDVKNSVLTSRSHFNETQVALADNLLTTRQFFSRGGRWITAIELAREGMVRAVKDMGL